ncbi:MAG: hypothetical protein D3917_00585 [Candidatus Electrothrix sp. AX5]|nr:hypothetical protein [Candidatus Electrothrix sp. AX5]
MGIQLSIQNKEEKMKKISMLLTTAILAVLVMTNLSQAAQTWETCTISSVAVFTDRIHVRCVESYSGVYYFAYPVSKDAAGAARFLSILTAARISGNQLSILYDPADDTSGVSYGCQAADCRPFYSLIF